jgi:ParB/RepB/Spo0J family partition protein
MIFELNLIHVVSNKDNSRISSPLQSLGYGVVEPLPDSNRPSLFELALGTKEQKEEFCRLVEKHDEGLEKLAYSIGLIEQLNPIHVRKVGEGEEYLIIAGARRCLAILYFHAKHNQPPVIRAEIRDADEQTALLVSAHENLFRQPMSVMEEAWLYDRLMKGGMKPKEIKEKMRLSKKDPDQTFRNRMKLLELTPEEQQQVLKGTLSQERGINLVKSRKEAKRTVKKAKKKSTNGGEVAAVVEGGEDKPDRKPTEGTVGEVAEPSEGTSENKPAAKPTDEGEVSEVAVTVKEALEDFLEAAEEVTAPGGSDEELMDLLEQAQKTLHKWWNRWIMPH